MNSEQFLDLFEDTVEQMRSLFIDKGREYTVENEDRLHNFRDVANTVGIHPIIVLYTYLDKHLKSIQTFVKNTANGDERKLSEPIEGRINDACLYLILLKALIAETPRSSKPEYLQGASSE